MKFVYDQKKSESNRDKHGLDFEQAKEAWSDEYAHTGQARMVNGELRWFRIGMISDRVFTVIFPVRGEVIRLISARPSSETEREAYEQEKR